MTDPILHLIARGNIALTGFNGGPHALVFGMNQRAETDTLIFDQLFRRVTGQALATRADKFHGPVRVVTAAKDYAIEIADQGRQHACRVVRRRRQWAALARRLFGRGDSTAGRDGVRTFFH